jgi:hypothetical protein
MGQSTESVLDAPEDMIISTKEVYFTEGEALQIRPTLTHEQVKKGVATQNTMEAPGSELLALRQSSETESTSTACRQNIFSIPTWS